MNTSEIDDIVRELLQATRSRIPIRPLRTRIPEMDVDDAYRVQAGQLEALTASGRRLVGRKIGLTSAAMQRQLGIDSPDFGYVLDDMVYNDGDLVPADRFIAPRIEPELAFHLREPLQGPGITREQAVAAVDSVFLALEIIDSRIADWDIGLVDTVADNASCGAIAIAREPLTIDPGATASIEVGVDLNGDIVQRGRGDAVLGDPIEPLVWLANTMGRFGVTLGAGEFVLTGSFCAAVPVESGDRVTADFGEHGTISVSFPSSSKGRE